MADFTKHIEISKKLLHGQGTWQDTEIPADKADEVARGTAILDAYTNWHLSQLDPEEAQALCMRLPSMDDGFCALDMYVYGAIQLADDFGTDDFYNYYSDWVDNVILPAILYN